MNNDILKGKWLEISGQIKEKWGILCDNYLIELEGKGENLLGILRKTHGYIRDKAELEYKYSHELAEIVSRLSVIMKKKQSIMAITFIARYGQLSSSDKQECQLRCRVDNSGADTYRYFTSRLSRHNTRVTQ